MTDRVRLQRPSNRVRLTRPRAMPAMSILDCIAEERLFKPWFRKGDWSAWMAFLAALFGLEMDRAQHSIYRECTGRSDHPGTMATEAWLVVGRRGGKSLILALCAVYLAAFFDFHQYLQRGEKGTVVLIAADRRQARTILRYISGLLHGVPMLKRMIVRETQDGFELSTGILIEIHTASFRTVRGYTVVAALLDELAFWRNEDSANPDTEIIAALRPAMATIEGALLLCASSPYAKRGALWNAYKRHFGKAGPILVWQAATKRMNPSIPDRVIEEAYEDDPASAAAEFGAEFRADIQALVSREIVEACVASNVRERPYERGKVYTAFCDPSGGSADSMTLAIAHKDGDDAVLDVLRERRPPFSPEDVTREFAALLKSYKVHRVIGDRYAGEWPRERFLKHGITYEASAKPKSELYSALLPLLNGRRCDLLDDDKLVNQIAALERRVARSGRDSIDHPPNGHDDLANAVAGVLTNLVVSKYNYDVTLSNVMMTQEERARQRGSANVNRLAYLEQMMTSRFW